VILVGFAYSVPVKGTERSRLLSRFATVPDVLVRKFTLRRQGAKKGLIVNARNLCRTARRAKVGLVAQSGLVRNRNLRIATGC
jgi:hypothetical protein